MSDWWILVKMIVPNVHLLPIRLEDEERGDIGVRGLEDAFLREGDVAGRRVGRSIKEQHECKESGFLGGNVDHDRL